MQRSMLGVIVAALLVSPQSGSVRLKPPNATLSTDFTMLQSIRELADGKVLVTDARENALQLVDFDADVATKLGRPGAGPLEYSRVNYLFALPDDSTFLFDGGNGSRWLVLHGEKIVGTIPQDRLPFGLMYAQLAGTDGRGRVIATIETGGVSDKPRTASDSILLIAGTRRPVRADTLMSIRSFNPPGAFTTGSM